MHKEGQPCEAGLLCAYVFDEFGSNSLIEFSDYALVLRQHPLVLLGNGHVAVVE